MAIVEKHYMDESNITTYDQLIKAHISNEDAAAYKTILLSQNNQTIYFYKKKNATSSDTPDFTLTLPSGTAITLNGVDKSGSSASFYAPTTVGGNGQVLISNGSGEPSWGSISQYTPQIDTQNHKLVFSKS